jgi:arylsulfatase A-like enzyme
MQSPGGAIRDGDYKLIEYYENGSVQLFDLKNDLAEEHDLSEAKPDKVLELRERLHDWRERVGAKMMAPNPQYVPREKNVLSNTTDPKDV